MKGTSILRYITLILAVAAGSVPTVHAQDFRQLASALRQKVEKTEKLHVVMDVQVFESGSAATPYFSERAEIKRDGVNYLSRFASNDLLMNDRYMVMVDNSSRGIMCSKRNLDGEKLMADPFKMNMDSVFNLVGQPKHVERSGSIEHYRLQHKEGLIEQIDLFVNTEKHFMQKIVYQYRDGQVARIVIQTFNVAPQFEPGTFQEDRYVTLEKGRFRTAPAFRNYTVLSAEDSE